MSYRLPDAVRSAIEVSAHGVSVAALTKASNELSESYREPLSTGPQHHAVSREHRLAYGIARAPATYGAISAALDAVIDVAPDLGIRTMTDLGAGPGTAMWAAASRFPALESVSCIERDGGFLDMGRELAKSMDAPLRTSVKWISGDLESVVVPPADLVCAAYTFSELDPRHVGSVVEKAWSATRSVLVLVEPGTPAGHAAILRYRSQLIALGAHIAAPCPHENACPMTEGDWCHFAARVDRSSLHRRLKGGELGHEDEKFAYVAVTRSEVLRAPARILRHPRKPPRVVELSLCAFDGLRRAHIGKGNREAWRAARDAKWGDAWRH